jgi:succinate-semialdehyde dehydrogenase/glutarate-semialdehyde dehydrogenase
MATTADPSATTLAEPTGSKHIDAARLAELAARVTTTGDRESAWIDKPFTGAPLGRVPKCTPDDVAAALERARSVQPAWAQSSFAERKRVLLRYHDLVLQRQDEILDLLQLEAGKARRHAFEEVLDGGLTARYYANTAEKHLRAVRRRGALPVLTATYDHHHPVGIVGVIAPWNYPLALSISDSIPAIAAGNAVIIKPDSQTPFSALWGLGVLEEAGLPPGVLQVVTGSGAELGPHLIGGVQYMMFTGSTATGRTVAKQCAERLIPCSMELGGKNAMLVLEDADLDRAVEGAERAMFSNAGQLCISIERLMVHEAVADAFTEKLAQRTRKMKLATGLDYKADMGSLISQSQLDTVRAHVEDALAKGATALAGGSARPEIGPYFHEPTLLSGVRDGMTCFADETFGPVVSISRFSSEDDAVARANASDYGLNASVWTRDTRRGRKIATQIQSGIVNVNEGYSPAWGSMDAPMGGMKSSGLGRRHGAPGILKYTDQQTVAVQRLLPIAPSHGLSQGLWARIMVLGLKVLRRMPGVR